MRTGRTDGEGTGLDVQFPEPLRELVMGLHWDPLAHKGAAPVDLDAVCARFDASGALIGVVHPASPRSADHSIVHTGDSRDGASHWDDERIFVFLDAVAPEVCALAFAVVSADGRPFENARGAYCHLSHRLSEQEILRHELPPLAGAREHLLAAIRRGPGGWMLSEEAPIPQQALWAGIRAALAGVKPVPDGAPGCPRPAER